MQSDIGGRSSDSEEYQDFDSLCRYVFGVDIEFQGRLADSNFGVKDENGYCYIGVERFESWTGGFNILIDTVICRNREVN
jgi:hypothetical protein